MSRDIKIFLPIFFNDLIILEALFVVQKQAISHATCESLKLRNFNKEV